MSAIRTRLAGRRTVTTDVVDLVFDLIEPPRLQFQAGQFVSLQVGENAGKPVRRSYSLASRSDQGESLRLIVKAIPDGAAGPFFMGMPLGTEVAMTGPHGFFTLNPEHAGDIVLAATGTGLAPILPMLGELAKRAQAPGTRRHVYWGLRNQADLFVQDELEAFCREANAELHTYLSQPTPGWNGLVGRITQPILESAPGLKAPTFYLVGNGAMINELKHGLVAAGFERKKHIRTEAFFD